MLAHPMASTVFLQKRTAFTKKLLTLALVAARTWRFATVLQIPWYMSLHFCDYNAMAMSFLWAVLDVLTIVVIGVG